MAADFESGAGEKEKECYFYGQTSERVDLILAQPTSERMDGTIESNVLLPAQSTLTCFARLWLRAPLPKTIESDNNKKFLC